MKKPGEYKATEIMQLKADYESECRRFKGEDSPTAEEWDWIIEAELYLTPFGFVKQAYYNED